MSREFGLVSIPHDLEIQYKGPIDPRIVVDTYEDLITEGFFTSLSGKDCSYPGMQIAVVNDPDSTKNGVYRLGAPEHTESGNWNRMGTKQGLLDYRVDIESYPTLEGVELSGDLAIEDFMFTFLGATIVSELPDLDAAAINTIYLVATSDVTDGATTFNEFILCVDEDGARHWEQLGDTTKDLTSLYTIEEATLLATFTQDPEEDTTSAFGGIGSGEVVNNIGMQELVERLFFVVADPVVTEPSFSSTAVFEVDGVYYEPEDLMADVDYGLQVTNEKDLGSITLMDETVGDYASSWSATIDDSLVTSEVPYCYGAPDGVPGDYDLIITATFEAGTVTPLKTDGSEADVGAYPGGDIVVTIPVHFAGAIKLNGTDPLPGCVNREEGYFEVTLPADPEAFISWDASYYGNLTGVKAYNGYTNTWDWAYCSTDDSLSDFVIELDSESVSGIIKSGEMFGEITIRCYYGESEFYSYSYDEETGITTVSITALGKAMINASTGAYVLPELEVEGDISLDYFLDGVTGEVDLSNIFELAEGSEA